MKKIILFSILFFEILIITFFQSCMKSNYEKEINKYYLLAWTNHPRDLTLFVLDGEYYIGAIGHGLLSCVGYDDDFIIVKIHSNRYITKSNKHAFSYYLIRMNKFNPTKPKKNTVGPLSKDKYLALRYKLGVEKSLKFTICFDKKGYLKNN